MATARDQEQQEEGEEEWNLDSDEIRSIASEDLREARPNRWKGDPQTWLTFTEEERLLHESTEQERNRDLAAHLYNAFALKNRKRLRAGRRRAQAQAQAQGHAQGHAQASTSTADSAAPTPLEDLVDPGDWTLPGRWTAWPLQVDRVPRELFLRETRDEHDRFTVRNRGVGMPGDALEEEVSAAILKAARERFQRRGLGSDREFVQKDEGGSGGAEKASPASSSSGGEGPKQESRDSGAHPAQTDSAASDNDDDDDDDDDDQTMVTADEGLEGQEENGGTRTEAADVNVAAYLEGRDGLQAEGYLPVASADDEASYDILRPPVRHILSQLDATLVTLHNARVASVGYRKTRTDGSASDGPSSLGDLNRRRSNNGKKKERFKANSKTKSSTKKRSAPASSEDSESGSGPTSESDDGSETQEKGKAPAKHLAWGQNRNRNRNRRRSTTSEEHYEDASDGNAMDAAKRRKGEKDRERERHTEDTWALRDWREVLGAAAISGFDKAVVERAAQRCADLFQQSMDFHTLEEGKAGHATTTVRPTSRSRGQVGPDGNTTDGDADEEEEQDLLHLEEIRRRNRLNAAVRKYQKNMRRSRGGGGTSTGRRTVVSGDEDFKTADEESGREVSARSAASRASSSEGSHGSDSDGETSASNPIKREVEQMKTDPALDDLDGAEYATVDINAAGPAVDGLYYCPLTHCRRHDKGFPTKRGLREHFNHIHLQTLAGQYRLYCPVESCKYHTRSFKSRKNLRVHLRNMHGGDLGNSNDAARDGDAESAVELGEAQVQRRKRAKLEGVTATEGWGSEDEVDGDVHVDGFLKPIKIRSGWLAKGGREKGQTNIKTRRRLSP